MSDSGKDWSEAWLDALAFGIGLAMAWYFQWETRDLVWSLWLSSAVIGYAMIVWGIFGTGIWIALKARSQPSFRAVEARGSSPAMGATLVLGGLFMLAFFTVHFGGFHFVHSVFLNAFFPVEPGGAKSFPGPALYGEVFQRYWWFLPAAAIAERQAFRLVSPEPGAKSPLGGVNMMAPYKNVIRLHLLIFFFAFAHFAKLENFLVYAIVYAVYFFPWRLVRKPKTV